MVWLFTAVGILGGEVAAGGICWETDNVRIAAAVRTVHEKFGETDRVNATRNASLQSFNGGRAHAACARGVQRRAGVQTRIQREQ